MRSLPPVVSDVKGQCPVRLAEANVKEDPWPHDWLVVCERLSSPHYQDTHILAGERYIGDCVRPTGASCRYCGGRKS